MAIIYRPNDGPQTAFLASNAREVLYGGAAGGGKSHALVYLPLRFVEHPQHHAIILRRTRPQLQETIDRTLEVYPNVVPGARWLESQNRWVFPSGAKIQMGFAEHENDIYAFKSFEYNLIEFDELTTFTEKQYKFMFMRNRTKASDLPLWIRSGTNPGDVGHDWVYSRFIENREPYHTYSTGQEEFMGQRLPAVTQQFIPSHVWDNPSLPNREEYIAGLLQMSAEEINAYLYGQWNKLSGAMFKVQPVELEHGKLLNSDYYVIRAMDFGYDDYTAVLWMVVYDKPGVIDIVGELYVRETNLDGIAHYVKEKEAQMGLRTVRFSVGSPEMTAKQITSNQSIADQMLENGVYVERANSDRLAGWQKCINLLERGAIRVWPGAAPNLLRTLPKLQRDPIKVNDVRNRPPQEDHAADAFRYGVMAFYGTPTELVKPLVPDDPNRDHVFDKLVKSIQNQRKSMYIPQLGEV